MIPIIIGKWFGDKFVFNRMIWIRPSISSQQGLKSLPQSMFSSDTAVLWTVFVIIDETEETDEMNWINSLDKNRWSRVIFVWFLHVMKIESSLQF